MFEFVKKFWRRNVKQPAVAAARLSRVPPVDGTPRRLLSIPLPNLPLPILATGRLNSKRQRKVRQGNEKTIFVVRRHEKFKPTFFLSLLVLACAQNIFAHGPFDHGARVWLWADNLEVTVTMGPEAAKVFLNKGPEEVRHAGHMEIVFPLPVESAARIFELKSGDTILTPLKTTVRSDGLEYVFGFIYPRTDSWPLHFNARYLDESPKLTKGALVVVNENDTMLVGKILSLEDHQIDFTPPAKTIAAVVVKNATETNSVNTNEAAVTVAPISVPPPVASSSFARNGARVIFALVILGVAFWLWQRVTSSGD